MPTREDLIKKLFSKKCSQDELKQLLHMIREDQSGFPPGTMDELFRQISDEEVVEESTLDRVWQNVLDHVEDKKPEAVIRRRQSRLVVRIAAAVAFMLISTLAFWYVQSERWIIEESIAGQIKTVALPDGSLVTLNGNSSLRYEEDWSDKTMRTVELEGEAYFKVKNLGDGTTKFQVLTSDLTVEVLGTSFNVLSWEEETSVFLEEGQIKVNLDNSTEQTLDLEPGELMSYSSRDKKLVPPKTVAKNLEVSWKQGVLEFEETSLEDILLRLTAPSNLTYTIMNEELSEREFTLRIPTEDMDVALDVLSRLTGTKIEEVDDRLIIEERISDTEEIK